MDKLCLKIIQDCLVLVALTGENPQRLN
jgi:hypothetical protein